MGVIINWHEITILEITNSTFYNLHWELLTILDQKHITIDASIEKLLEDMHACYDGIGLNLADYLHSNSEYIVFRSLLRIAIEEYNKKCPDTPLYLG